MSIDVEILNTRLANRIRQHIIRVINHDQVGLIPECNDGLTYASQYMRHITLIKMRSKNQMVASVDAEKAFKKIQHVFIRLLRNLM